MECHYPLNNYSPIQKVREEQEQFQETIPFILIWREVDQIITGGLAGIEDSR